MDKLRRKKPRRLTIEDKMEVIALTKTKIPKKLLADRFDISISVVFNIAKRTKGINLTINRLKYKI